MATLLALALVPNGIPAHPALAWTCTVLLPATNSVVVTVVKIGTQKVFFITFYFYYF